MAQEMEVTMERESYLSDDAKRTNMVYASDGITRIIGSIGSEDLFAPEVRAARIGMDVVYGRSNQQRF
jgi:hypothetical protein